MCHLNQLFVELRVLLLETIDEMLMSRSKNNLSRKSDLERNEIARSHLVVDIGYIHNKMDVVSKVILHDSA
jgi:hypothetical protein